MIKAGFHLENRRLFGPSSFWSIEIHIMCSHESDKYPYIAEKIDNTENTDIIVKFSVSVR